jgi:hypothetical protein
VGEGGRRLRPVDGVAWGLLAGAVGAVTLGWAQRNPTYPLTADRTDVTDVLVRTSVVVTVAVVLVTLLLCGHRRARLRGRRLAVLATCLVVAAVAGLVVLQVGGTAALFARAAEVDVALDGARSTVSARAAWWLACLAVPAAFVAALTGAPHGRPGTSRAALATLTAATLVGVLALSATLVAAHRPVIVNPTAPPAPLPPPPPLTGAVAYVQDAPTGRDGLLPAGPGFVRDVHGDGVETFDRVDAFDGVTGERRWSFSAPHLAVWGLASTGPGPDGVVVVWTSLRNSFATVGLDAMTGRPLWSRTDTAALPNERQVSGRSARVVLTAHVAGDGSVTLTGLQPRSGRDAWTHVLAPLAGPTPCAVAARALLTDDAVLLRSCRGPSDGPSDTVATMLDPATGDTLGALQRPPGATGAAWLGSARGRTALVHFDGSADVLFDAVTGRETDRLPDGFDSTLIDADSVQLTRLGRPGDPAEVAIYEIGPRRLLATPWRYVGLGHQDGRVEWRTVVRVGSQWATFLPDAGTVAALRADPRAGMPLRVLGADGTTRDLPDPCPRASTAHYLGRVPGAVLAYCGLDLVAVR